MSVNNRRFSRDSLGPTPSESSGEHKVDSVDFLQNKDLYFNTLDKLQKSAKKVRFEETKREQTLMEYLPVNERFSLNKEGKVLARWQERQRDWAKIQTNINKKIGQNDSKPLMMATADEFRARNEEYDLIQAAMPIKDRYADTWQLLLRGGGPVKVPVGHLFSGLECVYELKAPKPKMIRKPKPTKFTGKNDTFLEESAALIMKRTRYEKSIRSMRPHDLSYEAASSLVLRSVDLFKWAKDSSNAYFKEQRENNLSVIDEEESIYSKKSSLGELDDYDAKGPKVDFITTKEIVFESKKGENVFNSVKFKNTGKVTVSYKWKKMLSSPKDPEATSPSKSSQLAINLPSSLGSTLSEVIDEKGSDKGVLRNHLLVANRESFFCLESTGVILPQETIDSKFVFSNRAGGGVYNETWLIEFVPSDCLLIYKTDSTESTDYYANRSSCTGVLSVTLRGLCYSPDTSINKRKFVKTHIDRKTVESMVFDEINFCLRRVRDPVRFHNIQDRQITLFKNINANILENRSVRFTSMTPLFIIPERLESFCQIFAKSAVTFEKVINYLYSVRAELKREDPESFVTSESPFYLSDSKINEIRDILFPEKLIEIFDEITEDMLISSWDFNLTTIIEGLNGLFPQISEIEEIEESLRLRKITEEKERLRAERKAARLAAGNESDEEEEEEEEEEEPDDEVVVKPKHFLYVETDDLLLEVENLVNYLFTRPISMSTISDAIKTSIENLLDSFEETKEESLKAAEIYDLSVSGSLALPVIQSPFTTEEGLASWDNIMKQISLADTSGAPPGKGAKPPAKGKGAVTGPTPIQIDFYYNQFYNKILSRFLDVVTESFATIDSSFYDVAQTNLKNYPFSNELNFNTATLRSDDVKTDDITNSIVFVNFNGDSFTYPTQFSACGAQDNNKKESLNSVAKLIDFDAKAIVLIYEPDVNLNDDVIKSLTLLPSLDEIKTILYKKRAEFITREEKYTKVMRRQDKKFVNNKKFKELDLIPCTSYGELKSMLNNLTTNGFIKNEDLNYLNVYIPIIVVENILKESVVPEEPPFEEVVSDDDEAPINIGKSEKRNKMISDYYRKRPHKVAVPISTADDELIVTIDCYCNCYAALSEAYQIVHNNQNSSRWLEANPMKLFNVDKTSSFQNINEKFKISDRILSEEVRETFLWTGILQLMPTIDTYLSKFTQINNTNEDEEVVPKAYSMIDNFAYLFPFSLTNLSSKPTASVVLAGSVRIEKFRVLDQLIDFADSIYIAGEMSIPFIGLSSSVTLSKYRQLCSTYRKACSNIILKARLRGCKLVFPIDLLQGDEEIKEGERLKSFTNAQSDARNEGVDYEGEVKIISLSTGEELQNITISGFIYDIGPESLSSLKSFISTADLLYIWGTIGYCEVSSFQTGQQTLVNLANQLIVNTEEMKQLKNPLNTLLLGESTVEWFTRLIDTDGEMNGDLISSGIVRYANRCSDIFCGLVGQCSSNVMKESIIKLREPIESEWIYSKVVIETEEEDEDEDDEEDED